MWRYILLLVCSFGFLAMFSLAFAQEANPGAPFPSPSPVDYTLPYPGILPDHPLYIFKRLRDQLLLLLISNPIRKVDFYILLSDKQLGMGLALFDKNKLDTAVKITAESAANLKAAQKYVFVTPVSGNSQVANNKHRFETSLAKHIEVVSQIIGKFPQLSAELTPVLDQLRGIEKEYNQSN